jgi:isocitrate lyase
LIIIARTDAEAATLLDSNIDARDHPFILGVTAPGLSSLNVAVQNATIQGIDLDQVTKNWTSRAGLMTFGEAVLSKIKSLNVPQSQKTSMEKMWNSSKPEQLSNSMARSTADKIFGFKDSIFFDWESCRVREGYYQVQPGIDYCIQRARAYAPYSDLVWDKDIKYFHSYIHNLTLHFSCLDLDGNQSS